MQAIMNYIEKRRKRDPNYSQVALAREAGISTGYLNDIIHERAACGAGAAVKLVGASGGKITLADLLMPRPARRRTA